MRSTVLGIVIFLIACDFTFAQRKFFIGTNDDYAILGDQGITIKHGERDGSYVDYYVLRENESFVFMLTISKVHSAQPIDEDLIYSDSFKKSISNECSCDILDSNRASFNNFNGIEFLFKTQQSGRLLSVVSMSTVRAGILFNVNFIAEESRISTLLAEYKIMMNSLVFK